MVRNMRFVLPYEPGYILVAKARRRWHQAVREWLREREAAL